MLEVNEFHISFHKVRYVGSICFVSDTWFTEHWCFIVYFSVRGNERMCAKPQPKLAFCLCTVSIFPCIVRLRSIAALLFYCYVALQRRHSQLFPLTVSQTHTPLPYVFTPQSPPLNLHCPSYKSILTVWCIVHIWAISKTLISWAKWNFSFHCEGKFGVIKEAWSVLKSFQGFHHINYVLSVYCTHDFVFLDMGCHAVFLLWGRV